MEPISINLGVPIPEKDAIRQYATFAAVTARYSSPMKSRGFGRTGRLFAASTSTLTPTCCASRKR